MMEINQKGLILVNLILLQVFLVMTMAVYVFCIIYDIPVTRNLPVEGFFIVMVVGSILLAVLMVILFNQIIDLLKEEADAKVAQHKLASAQDMIQTLRAQQHDFLNHLQVVYSAAEIGKLELAADYFQGVVKQVKELNSISNIQYPEVAALLYSKVNKAEEMGVACQSLIGSRLIGLSATAIDVNCILGNLLDNALFALGEVDIHQRELKIETGETASSYFVGVTNRRPVISTEVLQRMFTPGFTTKGERGSGLGLANVQKTALKYGGKVEVISNEEVGTSFKVFFPKQVG